MLPMTGPGRRALGEAVRRHRVASLRVSQKEWADRSADGPGTGVSLATVKNVENGDGELSPRTLAAVDRVSGWPPGTAEAVLLGLREAPAVPERGEGSAQPVVSRRLAAELAGGEVLEVRSVRLPGEHGARVVLALVGDEDVDVDDIRAALEALDRMQRGLPPEGG